MNKERAVHILAPAETGKTTVIQKVAEYDPNLSLQESSYRPADQLDRLKRRGDLIIGLVAPGKDWAGRFVERYPKENDARRQRRLTEAALNLTWLLEQSADDVRWVVNLGSSHDLETTKDYFVSVAASDTIKTVQDPDFRTFDGAIFAESMLDQVIELQK